MLEKKFNWLLDGVSSDETCGSKIQTAKEAREFLDFLAKSFDIETQIRLTSSRYGLQVLKEALALENNLDFIKNSVFPFISSMAMNSNKRADYVPLGSFVVGKSGTNILQAVFDTPKLFEQMVDFCIDQLLTVQESALLGWLAIELVRGGSKNAIKNKSQDSVLRLFKAFRAFNEPTLKPLTDQLAVIFDGCFVDETSLPLNNKVYDHFDAFEDHFGPPFAAGLAVSKDFPTQPIQERTDFRQLSIFPSREDLVSKATLLPNTDDIFASSSATVTSKIASYLDWSFRLLREDIFAVIRSEIESLTMKSTDQLGTSLLSRFVDVIALSKLSMNSKHGVLLKFEFDSELLRNLKDEGLQNFWDNHENFLKPGSLIAILRVAADQVEFVSLGMIRTRELQNLLKSPPFVEIDSKVLEKRVFESSERLIAVQLSASHFAYEPFLFKLKNIYSLPFADEMLKTTAIPSRQNPRLQDLVRQLAIMDDDADACAVLNLTEPCRLDDSQKMAISESLKYRVALIQGPPGTGKSFCGAILAKILFDHSSEAILCVCFTNHALDQFLGDLLDLGIPEGSVCRLGGPEKISERMVRFTLFNLSKDDPQPKTSLKRLQRALYERLGECKTAILNLETKIENAKSTLAMSDFIPVFDNHALKSFEMAEKDLRDGKQHDFKWILWIQGELDQTSPYWRLSSSDRFELIANWRSKLREMYSAELSAHISRYDGLVEQLNELNQLEELNVLKTKRIIGCTTNGAAKYSDLLAFIQPGVVIMEEAGEILEAHVVASVPASAKQLIMIGDHKQLRPKLGSHELTVESGGPHKFNRSLFERLAMQGYPLVTLNRQHRMRREISQFIRELTYPELKDAEPTLNRQSLKGLTKSVFFIDHRQPEDGAEHFHGETLSKTNSHEVSMVLKFLKYLTMECGYEPGSIAILTPYLGQLQKLRQALASNCFCSKLGDLDVAELARSGLSSKDDPVEREKSVRVATVDNFQGEEADIVIASLVRSNSVGEVGFVGQPERVNVLLSRARDGVIFIGNFENYQNSVNKTARELWRKIIGIAKRQDFIIYYDDSDYFPLKCLAKH